MTATLAMSDFWNTVWLVISTFFFVAYLFVLFQIIVDLFRDSELSGIAKALWILGLIFLPLLTALIYIIARGRGMAQRQRIAGERYRAETEAYIRDVAGKSPAEQISGAKSLLDSGAIDRNEFERLKAKALA
ncbi:MAG: SHOCT domain-containing protein [Phycisphaerales bacterium]|nr:SHOCT domain-containing protein [Phycisphaerales bacterium]MCI0630246.1 SHOCT domain-containing protein [Phycisphaerales bacterium]MCI0677337.1 SHOCT domain-containing protein [Phycisphaerales bacterium]